MADTDPTIPGIEVPIEFQGVGISETEKEMSEFLDKTEKKTRKLKSAQEEVNDELNDEVKLRKKASDTGEEAELTTTKLLKKHREEGKKILGDSLKQYKMSKDPAVLKRMKVDLAAWQKKGKTIEEQADLESAMMKGDAKKVGYLMEEMNLLSSKEKVQQRLGAQLKTETGAVQGMLKGAAGAIPVIGAALAGGAIIEGVVSAVQHAVKSFMSWQREVVQLNEVFDGNKKMLTEAEKVMVGFGTQLGITRESLAGMVKQGLQLKVQTLDGEEGFRKWTKATMLLHKATGLALNSSGELLNTVAFKFGVGTRGIREVAGAFTHVTKTSRISADELTSYTKSLEGFMLHLPKASGEMKAAITADMMGIAGIISDVGGQPDMIVNAFTAMSEPLNKEGMLMAHALAGPLGKTGKMIQAQLEKGDMEGVFTDMVTLIQKTAEKGKFQLNVLSESWKEMGLNFPYQEMLRYTKIQATGEKGIKEYLKTMREKAESDAYLKKEAMKTTTAIDQMTNAAKNAVAQVWIKFGGIIVDLAKDILPKLVQWLIDLVQWFKGPGSSGISKFFKAVKELGTYYYDQFAPVARDMMDTWKGIGALVGQVTKTIEAFGGKGGKAMGFFGKSMLNVLPGFAMIKPLASVFRQIAAAIEWASPYLDKFRALLVKEIGPAVQWVKNIIDTIRDAFDDVVDALERWVKNSPTVAKALDILSSAFEKMASILGWVWDKMKLILGGMAKVAGFAVKLGVGVPLGLVSKALGTAGVKPEPPAQTDKASGEWIKNILTQASMMEPTKAKEFVEGALKALPRKEQRRAKADPSIQAVLEGKGAPATLKPTAPEAAPISALGDVQNVPLYAETSTPAAQAAPKVNVQADPKLAQAVGKQTSVLEDIRDLLGRNKGGGTTPVGTSLALSSMG